MLVIDYYFKADQIPCFNIRQIFEDEKCSKMTKLWVKPPP